MKYLALFILFFSVRTGFSQIHTIDDKENSPIYKSTDEALSEVEKDPFINPSIADRFVVFMGVNTQEMLNTFMPLQVHLFFPLAERNLWELNGFTTANWRVNSNYEIGIRANTKEFKSWSALVEWSFTRNQTFAESQTGRHKFYFEGSEWRSLIKMQAGYQLENFMFSIGPVFGFAFAKDYNTWIDYKHVNGTTETIHNDHDDFYNRDFTFGLSTGVTFTVFETIDLSAQYSVYRINFSPRISKGTILPRDPMNFYNDNWVGSFSFTIGYAIFDGD